jgi:recombinational DNA repair protein RecR
MNDPKISELTVSQLQQLIRSTVQEAVAEVIIEFNAAAEYEERLQYEAEMTDFLQHSLQGLSYGATGSTPTHLDD